MNPTGHPQDKKKREFPNLNAYVILFTLILLATVLTWIIPSGEYVRVEDPVSGRTIIDPESYHVVEDKSVNIFQMFQAIPRGIRESAGIIAFIFLISGAVEIVKGTGAIDAGIYKLVDKMKGKDTPLLVVIIFLFSLMGAAFGFAEETIPFIPLGVSLAVSLGYDRIVGFDIVRTAAFIGFSGAFMNPFSIGVAQEIAQLELLSGMGYRVVIYICFLAVGIFYILRYAKKVKNNPEVSHLYGHVSELDASLKLSEEDKVEFTGRHGLVLLGFLAILVALVYGVNQFGWYTTELSALFLGGGIFCGFLGGMNPNQVASHLTNGMRGVTFGALIVGFARAIVIILGDAVIMDTIIHSIVSLISQSSAMLSAVLMFFVQTILNFFIGSSSGLAAATMPIMTPVGDLLGVTRQTTVLAFQFGDGITNMFYPAMIYYLAFADIPYDRWIRHIWKLTLILSAMATVFVIIAVMFNYT